MNAYEKHLPLILMLAALWLPALHAEDEAPIDLLEFDLEELELDPVLEEPEPVKLESPAVEAPPTEIPPSPAVPEVELSDTPPPAPLALPTLPGHGLAKPDQEETVGSNESKTTALPEPKAPAGTEDSPIFRLLDQKNAELDEAQVEIGRLKKELKEVKAALHARSGNAWQSSAAPLVAEKPLPNRAVTLYNQAVAHHEAGEYGKAELKYLTVLEYEPTDGPTLYNLAILYDNALDRKRKANTYYSRFLLHHRNSPEATQVYSWKKALGY